MKPNAPASSAQIGACAGLSEPPSRRPRNAPPRVAIPCTAMKLVGEDLRSPAAIIFAATDSTVVRRLRRSMSFAICPMKGETTRSRKRGISFPVTVRTRP